MKTARSTLTLALLTIVLASPAMAQEVDAAKSCKSTSTSGKCLLRLIEALQEQVTTLQGQVTTLRTAMTAVQNNHALALDPYVSVDAATENGLKGPHVIFKGANVHVENGAALGVSNGLGNLIVGADDDGGPDMNTLDENRTGSHNLVVGDQHEFTSYDGFVAGLNNTISGNNASVLGGFVNTASGPESVVSGGSANTASGLEAVVGGGGSNTASGTQAVVSGGGSNAAGAGRATVSGGSSNQANAVDATVSGGECNTAGETASGKTCSPSLTAEGAVVSGGISNLSSGQNSSVGGGTSQTESGDGSNLN